MARLDALVLDLDGVVYRGDAPIAGAAEAIESFRAAGKRLLFLTNNSMRPPGDVVEKLRAMGIPVEAREVMTSAEPTIDLMLARGLAGSSVFLVGGRGIRLALEAAGFEIVSGEAAAGADIVVVGGDRSFDYAKMTTATRAVRGGATFLATNADPSFPTATGLVPGAGAILSSIELASGRKAEVVGKPNLPMMQAAAHRLAGSNSIAIVGDQPVTDLDGGRALGWTTILVLSGVTSAEEAVNVDPTPDLVVESLASLTARLGSD